MVFTYADLMRRLDTLERQLAEIKNLLAASMPKSDAPSEHLTAIAKANLRYEQQFIKQSRERKNDVNGNGITP